MAPVRARARDPLMSCGQLLNDSCRHPSAGVNGLERSSGRNQPTGSTRYAITSPDGSPRPSTEIRPGARAHPRHLSAQPTTGDPMT